MTTVQREKIARRKLSLLQLAQELGNVSKACKIVGYSRQQFYEIRRNFQLYGAEGLIDQLPGPKGPHPNPGGLGPRLGGSDARSSAGRGRVAARRDPGELRRRTGVWSRHGLTTKHERLLRLEETARERKLKLTDEQIELLERFSPEFRERHIEVHYPGDLVAVDTFFVGTLKGVGKVYLQTVLDCFSRYAWGRLYTSKLPLTAVQVMNNDVLPFFDEHRVRVKTVLSDNGREFCGRPDRHPYELFLQLEDIEHRTTKVGRPQSNGFIERFHRTLLDEHLRVKGRTTWYETVEEMQQDLEAYLETYNRKRPHRGRAMEGRTPYQVFKAGLTDARKAAKASKEEAKTKAA